MRLQHPLKQIFPLASRLPQYRRRDFKSDLIAGLTVGVMLIPQGMAYAVLAGLPPVYGLYASVVPLVIYSLMGTSRELAVGPVAIVSLLVLSGISELAEPGSERFIQLAILAALGAGVFQLIMGLLRMGFLVNFLSNPVLSGFTSAAAFVIGISQINNLLGIEPTRTHNFYETLLHLFQQAGHVHLPTAIIGSGSLLLLILLKIRAPSLPAALPVVAAATLITAVAKPLTGDISIVGVIPAGLPAFTTDFLNMGDISLLIPTILVISLVGYTESIAVAKAIASGKGNRVDPNQELVALGSANIGGAFFQSYPVTGSFSRTAVNHQSGAVSGIASLISAGLVALTVLFLTPLFYYLPYAVLSAVILTAVYSLFDFQEMRRLWKTDKRDFSMLMVTFFTTIIFGIEEGIAAGVVVSLVTVIYSSTRPHGAELGRLGNTRNFRNIRRYPQANVDKEVLIYRYDSHLYFANAEHFREQMEEKIAARGKDLKLVILDASAIPFMDSTGIHTLQRLIENLKNRHIEFYLSGVIGPVRDKLKISGVLESLGKNRFFFDVSEAEDYYRKKDTHLSKSPYPPWQTNL